MNKLQLATPASSRVRGFCVEFFDDGFSLLDDGDVLVRRHYPGRSTVREPETVRFLLSEARTWARECRVQM
jgi:hypothetical protein